MTSHENQEYKGVLRQVRKTTKNHPLEVAKNVWKRIPHLMQQHETPRKGFN